MIEIDRRIADRTAELAVTRALALHARLGKEAWADPEAPGGVDGVEKHLGSEGLRHKGSPAVTSADRHRRRSPMPNRRHATRRGPYWSRRRLLPGFRRFPSRRAAASAESIARSIRFAQAANEGECSLRGSSFSTARTNRVNGVACVSSVQPLAVVTLMPIFSAIFARSRTKPGYQARGAGPFSGLCCSGSGTIDKTPSGGSATLR